MKKLHYGWVICAGCTLLMFVTVGLTTTTFTVYLPYIISYDGLTNTQSSLINTLRSLSALVAFFAVDRYYRSGRISLYAVFAALAAALSFAIFGLNLGFWGYILGAVIGGASYALGGLIPTALLVERWFSDKRGMVLGICFAGTGVCAVVVPPLITALISSHGLHQAFFLVSAVILLLSLLLLALLRDNPAQKGLCPYGHSSGNVAAGEVEEAADKSVTKTSVPIPRAYYAAVMLVMMLLGAASDPAYVHISVLYDAEGYDLSLVTPLLSLAGLFLLIGKLALGYTADKQGMYRANYLFFSLLILGLAACSLARYGSPVIACIGMLGLGMGLSLPTVGISMWALDMSSSYGYARTLKQFQIFNGLGKVLFCTAPGIIADWSGSYVPAYVILTACSLLIAVVVQLTYIKCINRYAPSANR